MKQRLRGMMQCVPMISFEICSHWMSTLHEDHKKAFLENPVPALKLFLFNHDSVNTYPIVKSNGIDNHQLDETATIFDFLDKVWY